MNRTTNILCAGLLALLPWGVFTDDFGFDNLFEEEGTQGTSALEIRGTVETPLRLFLEDIDKDSPTTQKAKMDLELKFSTEKADFTGSLKLDGTSPKETEDLFNELYVTWYTSGGDLSLGYQKVVWGKGDKTHVVDVINPEDFSDFLNADYLDRKIPQFMIKTDIPLGLSGKAEVIYIPAFQGNQQATEGPWKTSAIEQMEGLAKKAVSNAAIAAYQEAYTETLTTALAASTPQAQAEIAADIAGTAAMAQIASQYSNVEAFLPRTNTIEYSQTALRLTTSIAGQDLGMIYYYGFLKDPTLVLKTSPDAPDFTVKDIDITYNRLQVLGLEYATVAGGFNLRGEGALYLTEDWEGDDPVVPNSSLNYLAGFDRGLPLNNLNVNLQYLGSYTLKGDNLSDTDLEYGAEETTSYLIGKISDSYNHEKIRPEVSGLLHLEEDSGFLRPALEWDINGNCTFKAAATYYWGEENTTLGQFDKDDYGEIKMIFRF